MSATSIRFCDAHQPMRSENAFGFGCQGGRLYMLLAEVSLGNSISEGQELPEGFHSIHAVGGSEPNPEFDVISTETGAIVPVGKVGRIGEEVPRHHVWMVSKLQGDKWVKEDEYKISRTAINYLDLYAQNLQPGHSKKLERNDSTIFHSAYARGVEELVVKRVELDESTWQPFDVSLLITRKLKSSSGHDQFKCCRYRMETYKTASKYPGTVLKPNTRCHNSEFVVFNEAQARIRYVVEIERNVRHG